MDENEQFEEFLLSEVEDEDFDKDLLFKAFIAGRKSLEEEPYGFENQTTF